MKKVITFLAIAFAAISLQAASDTPLTKGVDFTSQTGVSPSLLNNLVDLATLDANRGMIITQTGTPDTATYPGFTNYLWLDINTDPGIVKAYRAASNDWIAASVGAGSITTTEILDGTIAAVDIGTGAVTTDELGALSVSTAKIQALAVTTSELAANSVTTAKILDATVGLVDMANDSVNSAKIVDASIATADIAALAINNSLIAVGAVQSNSIAHNNVGNLHVQTDAIRSTNIVDGAVATNDVAFVTPFIFNSGTNNVYTHGANLVVAHGLTVVPDVVQVYLVCGTTEHNYSVGDEILIGGADVGGGNASVQVDATNVEITVHSDGISVINKTGFNVGVAAAAKWSFRIKAIAFQ